MPIVIKHSRFLPKAGGTTIKSWFGTKKAPYDIGRRFPGLFQTDGYHSQSIAFIIMLLLEFGAIAVTFLFAKSNQLVTAVFVAFFLFVCDLLLAWLLHRYHTVECEVENKKVKLNIAGEVGLGAAIQVLEEQKQKSKSWNFNLGTLGLIVLVGIKAFLLAPYFKSGIKSMGGKNDISEIMFILALVYGINAMIHWTCTGFVWAEFMTRWKYGKDEKDEKLSIKQGAIGIKKRFSMQEKLNNIDISDGKNGIAHKLYRIEDDANGTPQYIIESWCIFEDAVLQDCVNAQVATGGADTANKLADQLFLHQCSLAGI